MLNTQLLRQTISDVKVTVAEIFPVSDINTTYSIVAIESH